MELAEDHKEFGSNATAGAINPSPQTIALFQNKYKMHKKKFDILKNELESNNKEITSTSMQKNEEPAQYSLDDLSSNPNINSCCVMS